MSKRKLDAASYAATPSAPMWWTAPAHRGDPRRRVLDAFVWMAAHDGYRDTNLKWVLTLAEVPEPVFAEHFESKRDCMLVALQELIERTGAAVRRRIDLSAPWPERVRMGLRALLDELARDPDTARVMLVESLGAGEQAFTRLHEAIAGCAAVLAEGLESRPRAEIEHLPPQVSEAIAGGIASILHRRAFERRIEELPGLLPELLYFALMPYLGHEQALKACRCR